MITDKNLPMSLNRAQKLIAIICLALPLLTGLTACSGKKEKADNLAQQQVEELYSKGKSAMKSGNYQFAVQYFRALESNYPYGEYTEQAKLDMIFAFDKQDKLIKPSKLLKTLSNSTLPTKT